MFQLNVSFCYSQDLFYMIYHPRITPRTDSKQVYVFLRVTTSEVWNRFKNFLISTEQFNMDHQIALNLLVDPNRTILQGIYISFFSIFVCSILSILLPNS